MLFLLLWLSRSFLNKILFGMGLALLLNLTFFASPLNGGISDAKTVSAKAVTKKSVSKSPEAGQADIYKRSRSKSSAESEMSDIEKEELDIIRTEKTRLEDEKNAAALEAEINGVQEKESLVQAKEKEIEIKKNEENDRIEADRKLKNYQEEEELRDDVKKEIAKISKLDKDVIDWQGITNEPDEDFSIDSDD